MPKRPPPLLLQLHPPSFLSSHTNEKGRETGRNNPPPESCCKNSAWFGVFFSPCLGRGYLGRARSSRSDANPRPVQRCPASHQSPCLPLPAAPLAAHGDSLESIGWKQRPPKHERATNRVPLRATVPVTARNPPGAPCKRGGVGATATLATRSIWRPLKPVLGWHRQRAAKASCRRVVLGGDASPGEALATGKAKRMGRKEKGPRSCSLHQPQKQGWASCCSPADPTGPPKRFANRRPKNPACAGTGMGTAERDVSALGQTLQEPGAKGENR